MSKKKKIVCLGGGNAMPNAVLGGLKNCDVEIFSVSSMNDSGGSAGEEREFSGTPVAYGDIRRAAYQLSGAPYNIKERLNKRLETEEEIERARKDYPVINQIVSKKPERFKGHVLSNIISTATDVSSGTIKAIEALNKLFEIPEGYKILPATISNLILVAELENGETIRGETNIDKYRGNLKIKKVFFEGNPEIYPETGKSLERADCIVIGPGDLYSSVAQILLVKGVAEAVKKSKAIKIYICNLMRKQGETTGFNVLDFAKEVENYLHSELDFVVYNTENPSEERLKKYQAECPELIGMVVPGKDLTGNKKFIGENLLVPSGPIIHDSEELVETILNLCKR